MRPTVDSDTHAEQLVTVLQLSHQLPTATAHIYVCLIPLEQIPVTVAAAFMLLVSKCSRCRSFEGATFCSERARCLDASLFGVFSRVSRTDDGLHLFLYFRLTRPLVGSDQGRG